MEKKIKIIDIQKKVIDLATVDLDDLQTALDIILTAVDVLLQADGFVTCTVYAPSSVVAKSALVAPEIATPSLSHW